MAALLRPVSFATESFYRLLKNFHKINKKRTPSEGLFRHQLFFNFATRRSSRLMSRRGYLRASVPVVGFLVCFSLGPRARTQVSPWNKNCTLRHPLAWETHRVRPSCAMRWPHSGRTAFVITVAPMHCKYG